MVSILWPSGNSNMSAARSELFPAPLAPQIRNVERLFTRNESRPAERASMVPLAMSLVSVHGLTECFLIASASPLGLMGNPMTVALASNSLKSVSSTGEDWQNLSPLSRFRMFMRFPISMRSIIRLVLHLMCALTPSTPFTVTCMRLASHGASTYTSSM